MGDLGYIGGDIFGIWSGQTTTTCTNTAAKSVIWNQWSNGNCTQTASTGSIFQIWVGNQTTAATTTLAGQGSIWVQWATSGQSGQQLVGMQGGQRFIPARQTPEEAAEARRREEQYREEQKVSAERYRRAKERAEGLLYEHLTDEQRAEIKRSKFFVVVGGKTGRRYKINADGGLVGNVHEIDEGGALRRRLCAHINHAANAPIFDHLLAQKLMLEYEEEAFLRVANDHGR